MKMHSVRRLYIEELLIALPAPVSTDSQMNKLGLWVAELNHKPGVTSAH